MHKREFVLIFSAFFASFGLFLFIGLAGPPITNTVTVNATNLTPKLNKSQMAVSNLFIAVHVLYTFNVIFLEVFQKKCVIVTILITFCVSFFILFYTVACLILFHLHESA